MADLSKLLAELGGDNPQNRAIAEGLQKQGIASTNDIGVRKVPVPGHFEGTDEASYYVPETTENAYFNKSDGKEINPTRLGVYQVDKNGKAQGDIFFHLNADDKGNVTFQPQWSPRAHGYLRDNAVGQAIMSIGKIIPVTSPYFLAASAADAAAAAGSSRRSQWRRQGRWQGRWQRRWRRRWRRSAGRTARCI